MAVDKLGKALLDKLKGKNLGEFSIEFKPDEKNDSEVYLLVGSQPELKSQISLLMAIRQLLEFKDVGTFVGESYEPWVTQQASPLSIQVHLRLVKRPPWQPKSLWKEPKLQGRSSLPVPYITIPNVSRSIAADWNKIKAACGGANGYMWGSHYAVARLTDKQGGKLGKGCQMKVYASSKAEAEQRLKAFLELTQYTNSTISFGEESQTSGQRAVDKAMQKPDIRVYPAFYFIHNAKLVEQVNQSVAQQGRQKGRATAAGRKLEKQGQIPLYFDEKPEWVGKIIDELLTFS